jgi:hypothetical protein
MRFISPRLHGVLDYAVAAALIGVPLVLEFAASSVVAAALSIAAGIGLTIYSLLTDYSAGLRSLIPWRVHLTLDAVAAVVLLAAPFLFGFGGVARGFYVTVAIAVLAVVAVSRLDADAVSEGVQGAAVSRQTA